MLSIVSNNTRDRKINNVLESLEYYRSNLEITFKLVGDYYPFMVKDHVLNILTDPLRNYTLVELCIQNLGTQKWCSSACYHEERSDGFRTYNPIYQVSPLIRHITIFLNSCLKCSAKFNIISCFTLITENVLQVLLTSSLYIMKRNTITKRRRMESAAEGELVEIGRFKNCSRTYVSEMVNF
ncbi:hypothetical protein AGLY_017180 [Aphis glycines]|uniref:Uncharacterized protein n=1 Tax=Aphis glycines TaxID=307491 RepID=A0A6G0SXK4_APHGL|nr:hypothetical protein AGLY_017180 [Aphis glycines]